jgi:outer membrane receptor protein involved in Fe transport
MKPFNPCGARHERSMLAAAVLASLVNLPAAAEVSVSAETATPPTANEAQTTSRQGLTEKIDVTVDRIRIEKDESSAPIRSLSRQTIENAPAKDVAEALSRLTNVNIRRAGGPLAEPSLGMYGQSAQPRSSTSTTLAINGVALNNGIFPEASLNILPLAFIERVDVIQGPASSGFGNNARLGVINLQTPDASRTGAEVHGSAGRWDTRRLGASGSLDAGEFRAFLGVENSRSDGHLQPKGSPDFSNDRLNNFIFNVRGEAGPLRVSALLLNYAWDRSAPSYLVQPGNPAASNPIGTPSARTESGYRQHGHVQLDVPLMQSLMLQVVTSLNKGSETTAQNFNYGTPSGSTAPTDTAIKSTSQLARLEWDAGWSLLSVGAEHTRGDTRDQLTGARQTGTSEGLFIQSRSLLLSDRLVVLAGYRKDKFSFYDERSSSPKLGVVWRAEDRSWLLRANHSRSFSAPSFNQLFGSFGNPKLIATTLEINELGFEWRRFGGQLGITAFESRSENPIFPRPRNQNPICAPGAGNCFVNVAGTQKGSGVTLEWQQRSAGPLRWGISHTWLDPREATFATSERVLKADFEWSWAGWQFGGDVRRESGRFFQDNSGSPFPDFTVVNLKVGRALAAGLRADLILENASDETYSTTQVVSTSPAFPALPINRPGRFATLQFSWKF